MGRDVSDDEIERGLGELPPGEREMLMLVLAKMGPVVRRARWDAFICGVGLGIVGMLVLEWALR